MLIKNMCNIFKKHEILRNFQKTFSKKCNTLVNLIEDIKKMDVIKIQKIISDSLNNLDSLYISENKKYIEDTKDSYSYIHHVVLYHVNIVSIEKIKKLIFILINEFKCDINKILKGFKINCLAYTVLYLSNTKLVEFLIYNGADINKCDILNNGILHYPLHNYLYSILFNNFKDKLDMSVRNAEGNTPLHVLLRKGYMSNIDNYNIVLAIKLASDQKCLSVLNNEGKCVLYSPFTNNDVFNVRLLLYYGIKPCEDVVNISNGDIYNHYNILLFYRKFGFWFCKNLKTMLISSKYSIEKYMKHYSRFKMTSLDLILPVSNIDPEDDDDIIMLN